MPPSGAKTKIKKRSSSNSSSSSKQRSSSMTSSSMPGGSTVYAFNGSSQTRIIQPHDHDVLSGRGGSINSHAGNVQFREWVRVRKNDYNLATNKEAKAVVAKEVIQLVEHQNPPGRFLHKDPSSSGSGWWFELDADKIMSKTAQALREGAPEIRNAFNKGELNMNRKKRAAPKLKSKPAEKEHPQKQRSSDNVLARIWQNQQMEDSNDMTLSDESEVPQQPSSYAPLGAVPSMPGQQRAPDQPFVYEPPTKQVRMDYNGSIVRPNEDTPPLLPSQADPLLLPALSLPPPISVPTATGSTSNAKSLPRSHSLALSDISVGGDWMNEEFVNPFESESDELASTQLTSGSNDGVDNDESKLPRNDSSSMSLSTIPKPSQFLISSEAKSTESNGDMGGIGALLRNQDDKDGQEEVKDSPTLTVNDRHDNAVRPNDDDSSGENRSGTPHLQQDNHQHHRHKHDKKDLRMLESPRASDDDVDEMQGTKFSGLDDYESDEAVAIFPAPLCGPDLLRSHSSSSRLQGLNVSQ